MKYVLIIGAKSELGIELARLYASNQYNLYLAGRSINDMQDEADYLERTFNIKVILSELDVTDFISHHKFYESMVIKPIGVIYAAGYYPDPFLVTSNWKESANAINVNYAGAVSLLNIMAEEFYQYKSGFIVGIASVSGVRGRSKNYLYGAAKSAFSEYLSGVRQKFSNIGIHIITIKPGFINTKMLTNKKVSRLLVSSPYEIAKLIYNAYKTKRYVVYPFRWKIIMSIVVIIPEYIFKKLNF